MWTCFPLSFTVVYNHPKLKHRNRAYVWLNSISGSGLCLISKTIVNFCVIVHEDDWLGFSTSLVTVTGKCQYEVILSSNSHCRPVCTAYIKLGIQFFLLSNVFSVCIAVCFTILSFSSDFSFWALFFFFFFLNACLFIGSCHDPLKPF